MCNTSFKMFLPLVVLLGCANPQPVLNETARSERRLSLAGEQALLNIAATASEISVTAQAATRVLQTTAQVVHESPDRIDDNVYRVLAVICVICGANVVLHVATHSNIRHIKKKVGL